MQERRKYYYKIIPILTSRVQSWANWECAAGDPAVSRVAGQEPFVGTHRGGPETALWAGSSESGTQHGEGPGAGPVLPTCGDPARQS